MTKFKPGVRVRLNGNWKPSGTSSPAGTSGTVLDYEDRSCSRPIVLMDDQPNNKHYPSEEMIDIIPLTKDDQVVLDMATGWAERDDPASRANLIAAVKTRNKNLRPSLEEEIALKILDSNWTFRDNSPMLLSDAEEMAEQILSLIESRKND